MDELIESTETAVARLDRRRAAELCSELVARIRRTGDLRPHAAALLRLLASLQRKRYFAMEERVADAMIQSGLDSPRVRRRYAQALIDGGSRTGALLVLRDLLARTQDDPGENAEAWGLLGRAYKQLYVDAGDPSLERTQEMLRQALASYHEVYGRDPARTWHGINVVACLARAERDGVGTGAPYPPVEELALRVLEQVRSQEEIGTWELATALEACVALGRAADAQDWAARYVASSAADAFELGSTLRQLTEVWGLDALSELGAAVVPILRDALLRKEDGAFQVTSEEVRKTGETAGALERVLGFDYFRTLGWYRNGLARARAVARIGRDTGQGDGTGFLVRGRDLCERFGDELLLVTNAHVVSDRPEHNPAVPDYRDALVTFEALERDGPEAETYAIREVLGSSGPRECDFAVLRLDREVKCREPIDPYQVANGLPANDGQQRVYIIGHPGGGSLSFSMHDNLLLDYDDRLMHYRTPTEGGSSGSPVFNAQWKLVGLHHAGYADVPRLNRKGGTYAANEGISVFAIRKTLAGAPAP